MQTQTYQPSAVCAVSVDFAARQDPPLLKRFGVMNSGLVDSTRYNDTIFDSLAAIKVLDLRLCRAAVDTRRRAAAQGAVEARCAGCTSAFPPSTRLSVLCTTHRPTR